MWWRSWQHVVFANLKTRPSWFWHSLVKALCSWTLIYLRLSVSSIHISYFYIGFSVGSSLASWTSSERPAQTLSVPPLVHYLQDPSSAVFVVVASETLFCPQSVLVCAWVWLYCVVLEPRLDSAADCICFTQTHQERDIIEIPCLAFTFGFLSRRVSPALLFSFKLELFSFIFSLRVTLFVFFLLLSFGICLPIQSEILPSWQPEVW